MRPDSPIDPATFARRGFHVVDGFLDDATLREVRGWIDTVHQTTPVHGRPLQHFEETDGGPRLCRSENFVPCHDGLRRLVTEGPLPALAAEFLGEAAVLYKEKINYKFPGGAGYAPHQDATAYKFVHHHVTCMVAIDDATIETGCLEFAAPDEIRESEDGFALMATDGDGCMHPDLVARFAWHPVPVAAGGLLWFHSRAPHRSGPNEGSKPRRGMFLTYNAASEGDLREAYYRDKIRALAAKTPGTAARISTIGHFQGRAPTTR